MARRCSDGFSRDLIGLIIIACCSCCITVFLLCLFITFLFAGLRPPAQHTRSVPKSRQVVVVKPPSSTSVWTHSKPKTNYTAPTRHYSSSGGGGQESGPCLVSRSRASNETAQRWARMVAPPGGPTVCMISMADEGACAKYERQLRSQACYAARHGLHHAVEPIGPFNEQHPVHRDQRRPITFRKLEVLSLIHI